MLSGKPRGVAHAFWNPTDKLARTVEVIARQGLRPSSKNWRRPRPAMPGRPSNDGRTSRPSTGSATSPNWYRPEGEAPPEADRRVTVIRSARKGRRRCRSRPFIAAGSKRASRIGRSERLCDVVEIEVRQHRFGDKEPGEPALPITLSDCGGSQRQPALACPDDR